VLKYVFVGKHTHQDTLDHLLGFLEFIVINSDHKVTLGTANIDRLWQIFVQQSKSNVDQILFLKWINKNIYQELFIKKLIYERKRTRKEHALLNEEERVHFFTNHLCNPTYCDFGKISVEQVECFHKLFKVINRPICVIESSQKRVLVKEFSKILGLDILRRIAVESENERSREDSMNLLVEFHFKFDIQLITLEMQASIWQGFIDLCIS
jgi:hypothetical protein